MDRPRPRGLYFEEFVPGQVITSPGRTITEADVVAFAGLSGDYNPLHTDVEFARETPYGQRIAHGLLGVAVASGLAARAGFIEGTTQAFVGLTTKFKAPVLIGDTIHLRATVSKLRPMPSMGGGMVVFAMEVRNQHGAVVQEGDWTLLMRSRPDDA
ncbi:MAG TPA: dehydratase [Chloroflexi bacterium]|jgi:acyl dehydratase|nr:dehydratase [Chloroflexota bacterium]